MNRTERGTEKVQCGSFRSGRNGTIKSSGRCNKGF